MNIRHLHPGKESSDMTVSEGNLSRQNSFHRGAIESRVAQDRRTLWVIKIAQNTINTHWPSISDIDEVKWMCRILKDAKRQYLLQPQPVHPVATWQAILLNEGLQSSIFLQAMRLLSSSSPLCHKGQFIFMNYYLFIHFYCFCFVSIEGTQTSISLYNSVL